MCEINTHINGKIILTMKRSLLEKGSDVFMRYNEAISILQKVQRFNENTLNSIACMDVFKLKTNFDNFKLEPFENSIKPYNNAIL